jgi:hypothetical protein
VGVTQKAVKLQVTTTAATATARQPLHYCERFAQDDSKRFLKEAKEAMKPVYAARIITTEFV